ncbi:hypothetical protein LOB99_10260, partial [Lactobacillus delbrueckii subsp. lactis]|nr:hypothetical protein [Lactobacillus delbrueckii subsp. lactis]
FPPPEVHAGGINAITSSLIEYLLAKLLSFQGFIVLFGVGSLSNGAFDEVVGIFYGNLNFPLTKVGLYLENSIV